MRKKKLLQMYFNFRRESSVKIVREERAKYEAMDRILDEVPEILNLAHKSFQKNLSESMGGRESKYTSETLLRAIIVMHMEGASFRRAVVRIEENEFLRGFVKLGIKPMMDFGFLNEAYNALSPETWKAVNGHLGRYAKEKKKISGEKLRIDTTVCETNVHYPTDSSLLWDSFRTLVRLLRDAKEACPGGHFSYRFHDKKVKRFHTFIQRNAKSLSRRKQQKVRTTYRRLMEATERAWGISADVARRLSEFSEIRKALLHYQPIIRKVMDQTERRVFQGEKVPADEKIYSIFEEHTELLKRGKAGKPVEFGHMILLGQTEEKFISQYKVMKTREADQDLVDEALSRHESLFGAPPSTLAADKGFYESMEKIRELEEDIETVSIAKKGSRTAEEAAREKTDEFVEGQRFRAGIEGTISALKREFHFRRSVFKGIKHYTASIGGMIFCHNLVVLAKT